MKKTTLILITMIAIYGTDAYARIVSGKTVIDNDPILNCDSDNKCTDGRNEGYVKDGTFYVTRDSYGNEYQYYDNGLMSYYRSGSRAETYTYDGNIVTIKNDNPGQYDWSTDIRTYRNAINSPENMQGDPLYATAYYPNFGETSKFMQSYDENGNALGFVNASFDAEGNIINFGATIWEPYTDTLLEYENGRISSVRSMPMDDYSIIYDESGRPVSKVDNYGNQDIIETYDFTSDGKLKVCDAQGQNCETTEYSSLEDYLLAPYDAINLTDVFDSDFGQKGYVPSRSRPNESSCYAKGQVFWDNACLDEYPFAKKRWTPAEANEWLHDGNDNFVILTFRK